MIDIKVPDSVRHYMDLQCNGDMRLYTDFPGLHMIDRYLRGLRPQTALDVGSGIGRASVFFSKHYDWKDTQFILADGNSGDKQLAGIRKGNADFYNSIQATEEFCAANDLYHRHLHNMERAGWADLPAAPDLVYSFAAIGFHWPLHYFLKPAHPYLAANCLLLFSLRTTRHLRWTLEQVAEINQSLYEIVDLTITTAEWESHLVLRRNGGG